MIEINLLPGAQKRKKRSAGLGISLKMPASLATLDRMTAFIVAAWIVALVTVPWLYFGIQSKKGDVQVALDTAVADSARYAALISTQASLRAREDTIAQKLAIIQEIDAGRFIWPHIMDEISRALPPYTWLTAVDQLDGGPLPSFQIEGRSGSLPALTRFMDALEASPFLRNIELVSSEQAKIGNGAGKIVNNFVLTGSYERPPLEAIETVPLLEGAATDSVAPEPEASHGAGPS